MVKSSLFASRLGLLLLLGGVIASAYFSATLIAAFLLLILLLCACARLWSGSVLSRTHVSIPDGQNACHAGDALPLTIHVHSRSLFPMIWLDVTVPLGHTLIFRREGEEAPETEQLPYQQPVYRMRERFAWLLWQQEIACQESMEAVRRGVVEIDQVSLQAGDGLGIAANQRWQTLARPVRLIAYPRLVPVDVRPFTQLLADAEAGARGQTEDVTLLRSSRPYQYGDPMKRINWRHLAMSGQMETNQYEMIQPGCITFLLDLYAFRYHEAYTTHQGTRETRLALREDALEDMLSVLASCMRALCERSVRFALIIPGYAEHDPVVCRPGSGDLALYPALEALAGIDYASQAVALPLDEIRRLRRKLGVVHLCSYTDVPTCLDAMEALGIAHLRAISCLHDAQAQRAGELPCTLLRQLDVGGMEGGVA